MAGERFVICARALDSKTGGFKAEPGRVRYLLVPAGADPNPDQEMKPADWAEAVRALADGHADANLGTSGDVLIFVHGYNNDQAGIMSRHDRLQTNLAAEKWRGVVVSFDWPSENNTLNYLEDRSDAAETARELVDRGITLLARGQDNGCETNVHLLGHSTGAYVIMESFAQAEKNGGLFQSQWRVGQAVFIAGDIAADSLSIDSDWARPMYRRIMRLTNYQNPFDSVLAVSNAKRLGVSPRAGRIGLPEAAPRKAVNVHCGDYFQTIDPDTRPKDGTFCHSWHFADPLFTRDLAMTLEGRIDREAIPTRTQSGENLILRQGARPAFEAGWYRP